MAVEIAVQVVNYNTKARLIECLDSVLGDLEGAGGFELRVLDNASRDDLGDLADRLPGAPLAVERAERNLGFGAGQNRLARRGSARRLLILNPDTRLIEPRTIARLIERLEASGAQAAGPMLVKADGRAEQFDHGELRGWRAAIANGAGHSHWETRAEPTDAAWVSGACMLIEADAFERLGGFDERFFLYKEEEDLLLRLRRDGGRVVYDPTVRVLHHGSVVADPDTQRPESVRLFAEKHFDRPLRRRTLAALHRLTKRL